MIEIDKVEIAEPLRAGPVAALDAPAVGGVNGMVFRVAGWLRRPRGSPKPKLRFHLAACAGAEPAHWDLRTVQSYERTDVPSHEWESAVGFEGYVDGALLPRKFRILISYQNESREEHTLGEVAGRRTFISGKYKARFHPVAVYHGGRMGSTAIMHALLAHPEIAVSDQYPFENNTTSYLTSVSNVLLQTALSSDDAELGWHNVRRTWHH